MAARERPSPFAPSLPTRADAKAMDAADPLALARHLFSLPPGAIYLDGNSLGALPRSTPARLQQVVRDEWGGDLIASWNKHGWIDLARRVGDKIAKLIGAAPGTVRVGSRAALMTRLPPQIGLRDHVDPDTGALRLFVGADEAGAPILWDVSGSAGAVPLDLSTTGIVYAIGDGCGFLNGGPGAPSFLYSAQGHPARDTESPPILSLAALEVGVDAVLSVPMTELRAKSQALTEIFRTLVQSRAAELNLEGVSPADPDSRGSQISFRHAHADAIVQALIAQGATGDFRAPDILRFGFAPLYVRYVDAWDAAAYLVDAIESRAFEDERFHRRQAVT